MSGLDILLLTEEDFVPEDNWLYEVNRGLGLVDRKIRPPHDIHLNISLLAPAVEQEGFSCKILDNFLHLPHRARRLDELLAERPLAVGLSTTFLFNEETIRAIAHKIRAASPESKILLGGPSILQFPEWRRYGDITVMYDGEKVLPAVLRALKSGADLGSIPGIEFSKGGKTVVTAAPLPITMEDIPFPDWSRLGYGLRGVYPIETQRGCVYKCKFCTHPIYSRGVDGTRYQPLSRVISEIRHNFERWGIVYYRFIDSTFTFPKNRALELCREIIRTRIPIQWSCYGRVDNMTPELAGVMSAAGCRCIFFGIESGDDGMLLKMRKDFRTEHIHRGIEYSHKAGIASMGSFVVGYPGETEESLTNTLRCVFQSRPTFFSAGPFWLDHNAPAWEMRHESGLSGRGNRWKHRTMDFRQAAAACRRLIENIMINNASRLGLDFILASSVNLGLNYDEALRFMRDKGILLNHRLAEAQNASMTCFDPIEVREARENYQRSSVKIVRLSRSRWRQDPETIRSRQTISF